MHSLWFVQWDFTRRDHPGNPGGVSGSGPVNVPYTIMPQIITNPSIPFTKPEELREIPFMPFKTIP